jgi:hypothetical protein
MMTFLFSEATQFVTYAAAVRGSFSTSSGIFDMGSLNHSEHIRLWYRLAMADGGSQRNWKVRRPSFLSCRYTADSFFEGRLERSKMKAKASQIHPNIDRLPA